MIVVVSGYVGKRITGIGRNLISLLDNSKRNIKYVVYTNYDMKNDLVFENPNVIVRTYPVSKNNSLGNIVWTAFVYPFIAKKEKADRSLIPNFSLVLIKTCPTIVIIHDLIEFNVKNKFSPLKMIYRKHISDPLMVKRSDHIITVSNNSKNDIINHLKAKPEKISVINNGVNRLKFFRMNEIESEEIFDKKNWPKDFILYVGTVDHPGKNAYAVIRTFEQIKRNGKYNGSCILAGMPGKGFTFLRDYINKSIYKKDIVITGYVSDKELVALYSRCRIFIFLSLYEGFGIPPLEALACGARVVVSDTSSLPEVVGEVGSIVNPCNLSNICEVVCNELRRQNDDAYHRKVEDHLNKFSWTSIGDEFDRIIAGDLL